MLKLLLILACLGCSADVSARDIRTNSNWLQVVAFAAHQTDYSGTFVYQYDGKVETSRITHVVQPDSEYEKIESLDGPRREVIRHHGKIWFYINHKMVQIDGDQSKVRFPALLPAQLSALSDSYVIKDSGSDRVAGVATQVITLQPKDGLRYARKIWAHTETGLLVKAIVLNEKNQVVEQYAFTDLKLGEQVDRAWVAPSTAAGLTGASQALSDPLKPVTQTRSGWGVDALPIGFKKTMEVQRLMPKKHTPATQLVYSDGLSAISVFIEANEADKDDSPSLTNRGALNLYRKVVDKHLLTVVGEVPERTVMQILDSVRFHGKK